MRVELNGKSVELPAGATVGEALAAAGIGAQARGVAVAVGGEVVSRSEWATRELAEGESVEVVQAVQGG